MTKKKITLSEKLRLLNLKATPARIAVMQFLESSDKPIDTSEIIDYLGRNHVEADPATVFRILGVFTHKGLIRQIQFNEGKFRYEMGDRGDHHHLICESCGKVEDIGNCSIPALEKNIKIRKKFLVKRHSLEFFGLCARCQK